MSRAAGSKGPCDLIAWDTTSIRFISETEGEEEDREEVIGARLENRNRRWSASSPLTQHSSRSSPQTQHSSRSSPQTTSGSGVVPCMKTARNYAMKVNGSIPRQEGLTTRRLLTRAPNVAAHGTPPEEDVALVAHQLDLPRTASGTRWRWGWHIRVGHDRGERANYRPALARACNLDMIALVVRDDLDGEIECHGSLLSGRANGRLR